jgi:hypothetical protein
MMRFTTSAAVLTAMMITSSGAATMQQNNATGAKLLKLADAEYFQLDQARQSALKNKLIVTDYEGTALGGPAMVDLAAHDTVPLLWATSMSNLRRWKVVTERNSTLLVSDLNSGKVSVHDAFFGPKKLNYRDIDKSAQGSQAAVLAPGGVQAALRVLDLAATADLARPGRYAITLLLHDWASNTVPMSITRNGAGLAREAEKALHVTKAAYQAAQEKARAPAFNFVKSELTPALAGRGIVLGAPGARAMLHGAARLPLVAGNMADGGAAVLRLTVLLAQIDKPLPHTLALEIPLPAPQKAGDEASVAFHVDLEAALKLKLAPATYQVYVAGGEYVAGPATLTIAP